jgi:hypothetical protein
MQPDQFPLLYDRLAGGHDVATVLEDLIDRVLCGPRLNSNPAVDEAHHRVSSSGSRYLVPEMACEAAGGPRQYSGRPMVTLTDTSASPRTSESEEGLACRKQQNSSSAQSCRSGGIRSSP